MSSDDQFKEIASIREQLEKPLNYSSSRNYLRGSVYVERSGKIIGLCIDGEEDQILQNLQFNPENLPYLQDLVIRSSNLHKVPDWMYSCPMVENLVMKDLNLRTLDDLLVHLNEIKFLALPNNQFKSLKGLENLESLSRLNLNYNLFETFPIEILSIRYLVSLTMNENYIKDTLDYIKTTSLQAISLKNNQLTEFPDFLKEQSFLHHLDLSSNFIEEIPSWLGDFFKLQYLHLSHNKIRSLPVEIENLQSLVRLQIDYNNGIDLPLSSIYQLKKLQEIDLRNSIEDISIIEKLYAWQKLSGNEFNIVN